MELNALRTGGGETFGSSSSAEHKKSLPKVSWVSEVTPGTMRLRMRFQKTLCQPVCSNEGISTQTPKHQAYINRERERDMVCVLRANVHRFECRAIYAKIALRGRFKTS